MALFAIGDLHLSLGADKPMDVFGGAWDGYVDKLRAGLQGGVNVLHRYVEIKRSLIADYIILRDMEQLRKIIHEVDHTPVADQDALRRSR